MSTNELSQDNFDYSILDEKIAKKLKDYSNQLDRIFRSYAPEVGEVLYKAQQEFSNPRDGTFIKWMNSKGIKTQSGYNYINIYNTFQSLESKGEEEVFSNASKSLQIEMSKPSANKELNEKVYRGDITTHKEYKELEQKLKEKDELIESMVDSMHDFELQAKELADENEQLKNKPAEVVEKVVEPADYQQLKRATTKLQDEINQLEEQLSRQDENSRKYEELNRKIKEMNGRLTEGQKRIQAQKDIYRFAEESNQAIDKLSTLIYLVDEKEMSINEYAREPIEKIVNDLEDICSRLKQKINQPQIIEGEFTHG